MTIKSIAGIDHAVVVVKDLDAAADNWKRLGFTISPRGTHSAHMGTGNYTIMLGEDYMELLGVLNATEHNAPSRAFLDRNGGGIERIAFTTPDARRGRGGNPHAWAMPAIGPTDFERPVTMPDGRKSAAKFATFQWPVDEAPGGVRLFACQHKTRETVWIPGTAEARQHREADRARCSSPRRTPEADAKHLAKMIDGEVRAGRRWRVRGADRVSAARDFVFLTPRGDGEAISGRADVSDLPAARRRGPAAGGRRSGRGEGAAGAKAVSGSDAVVVPPAACQRRDAGVRCGYSRSSTVMRRDAGLVPAHPHEV